MMRRVLFSLALFLAILGAAWLGWQAYLSKKIQDDPRLWQGDYLLRHKGQWYRRDEKLGQGALGCQKPEGLVPIRIREGAKRVVIIGSSLTYGTPFLPELKPPQTAWQLAQAAWHLQEKNGAPKLDIINLSYPGAQSLNLACLARSAAALKPDLVLFQPSNNEKVGIGARAWQACLEVTPLSLGITQDLVRGKQHKEDWCFFPEHPLRLDHALAAARKIIGVEKLVVVIPPAFENWPTALPSFPRNPTKIRQLADFWKNPKAHSDAISWLRDLSNATSGNQSKSLLAYNTAMTQFLNGDMEATKKSLLTARDLFPGIYCLSTGEELKTLLDDTRKEKGRRILDMRNLGGTPLSALSGERMADSCHPDFQGQLAMAAQFLGLFSKEFGVSRSDLLEQLKIASPSPNDRKLIEARGALSSLAFSAHKGNLNLSLFQLFSRSKPTPVEHLMLAALLAPSAKSLITQKIYKKNSPTLQQAAITLQSSFPKTDPQKDKAYFNRSKTALDQFFQTAFPGQSEVYQNTKSRKKPTGFLPLPPPWKGQIKSCQSQQFGLTLTHPRGEVEIQISKGGPYFKIARGWRIRYVSPENSNLDLIAKEGAELMSTLITTQKEFKLINYCSD